MRINLEAHKFSTRHLTDMLTAIIAELNRRGLAVELVAKERAA